MEPHQISIMVMPGFMKPRTCCRTCLCASAAWRKSFQTSSLALSSARFSWWVVRHAALRLGEQQQQQHMFTNCLIGGGSETEGWKTRGI